MLKIFEMKKKLILIPVVHPTGNIFNIPCVPRLVEALAEIYPDKFEFFGVKNSCMPSGTIYGRVLLRWMPGDVAQRPERSGRIFIRYGLWVVLQALRSRPHTVLAVGLRGLLIAGVLNALFGSRIIYNCLELYPDKQGESLSIRILRRLEIFFSGRAELIIIQDAARADLMIRVNRLIDAKFAYFPNFPLLPSKSPSQLELDRFRDSLGIEYGKRIILFAGGIYPGMKLLAAIEQIDLLPRDWCMVIQSHDGANCLDEKVVHELVNKKRLYLFLKPLDQDDYWKLLNIVDVGLAWYPRTGNDNMTYVGLSSGKVSSYWAAGKPILINRIPFYEDVVPAFGSGIIIDCHDDIPSALKLIAASYDDYSRGAMAAYEEFFSYERVKSQLGEVLNKAIHEG